KECKARQCNSNSTWDDQCGGAQDEAQDANAEDQFKVPLVADADKYSGQEKQKARPHKIVQAVMFWDDGPPGHPSRAEGEPILAECRPKLGDPRLWCVRHEDRSQNILKCHNHGNAERNRYWTSIV